MDPLAQGPEPRGVPAGPKNAKFEDKNPAGVMSTLRNRAWGAHGAHGPRGGGVRFGKNDAVFKPQMSFPDRTKPTKA